MARLSRKVIPGYPYHVTQRGIRRSDVFFCDSDRYRYLNRFAELSVEHSVEVLSYCLMTTHTHHILVPGHRDSLANLFRSLHSEYALKTNLIHEWSGHLFQGRFFSCLMDDHHLTTAIRYVELNPVRAGMKDLAEDYRWSSARAHIFGLQDPILTKNHFWIERKNRITNDWSNWLRTGVSRDQLELIRKRTKQGVPFASDEFIKNMEETHGIRLFHKQKGRPRKSDGNQLIVSL